MTTVDEAREALLNALDSYVDYDDKANDALDALIAAVRAEYEGFIDEDDCAHSQKVALERQRAESAETLRALREAARAALDDTPKERWLGGHDWLAEVIGYYEGGTAVYPQDGQPAGAVEPRRTGAALAATQAEEGLDASPFKNSPF